MRVSWLFGGSRSPAALGLVALVVGVAAGIGVSAARSDTLNALAGIVEPLGIVWVNAIRMILVPLVVSLLITSVTGFSDVRSLGRLGARTIALFILFLAGAAVFSALIGPPLFSRMEIPPEVSAALRSQAQALPPAATPELPTLRGFIVGLVPTNPIRAAADGAMLPLIVFTLVTIAMSFSNPGIPSGGLFVVTAPVMLSAGLPLEGIGLLIAADSIPDVFATVVNVTGDLGVAAMVADTTGST